MLPRDITGMRFCRLTAQSLLPTRYILPNGRKIRVWRCVCDCGNSLDVLQNALTGGKTRSCGCLRKEAIRATRNYKICRVCGKRFPRSPSTGSVTCCKACSIINRSRTHWVLKSPEDVLYECDNLSLFVKMHPEFFADPKKAYLGLAKASDRTGKSRRACTTNIYKYKGWTVVSRSKKEREPST